MPYTWGTLGIIYNTTMVDEPITSWDVMFSDQYKGNVMLIDNSRDAFGMALYSLGYSVNTTDEAQIREAYELVADAWNRGVYQLSLIHICPHRSRGKGPCNPQSRGSLCPKRG